MVERVYQQTIKNIQALVLAEDTKDITFVFPDTQHQIKAHKLLLTAASPTFASMFSGHFIEKDTATITDVRPEIFQLLINSIYLNTFELTSIEDAVELYTAADMYNLSDLCAFARRFMRKHAYWTNALYLYDIASFFGLSDVQDACLRIFHRFDYQTLLYQLSRNEVISDEAFVAAAKQFRGEHGELYQILETFVVLGKIKSYAKSIGTISFLAMDIEDCLTVKLLTDEEKVAIIANLQSEEARFTPFIEMPSNLSKALYKHVEHSEARDYTHLIWTILLLMIEDQGDYFKFVLRKVAELGPGFMEPETWQQAFSRPLEGKRMRKCDFEYLFTELDRYMKISKVVRVIYDEEYMYIKRINDYALMEPIELFKYKLEK